MISRLSCTSNPFSSDEEISGASLTGTVRLSDGSSPDSVYVWLEGFNLQTFTDDSGYFSFSLPPPETQGFGKGFNGDLNIYYYFANYKLDSSTVTFADGKFALNQKEINEDGSLIEVINLSALLQISTSVFPSAVHFGEQKSMYVEVYLKTFQYPLQVEFIGELHKEGVIRTGMIFKSINNPIDYTRFIDTPDSEHLTDVLTRDQQQDWRYYFELDSNEFLPGKYLVFPFILIKQENIPPQLMESMGNNIEEFGMDYLKLPMKRTDGLFEVLADEK